MSRLAGAAIVTLALCTAAFAQRSPQGPVMLGNPGAVPSGQRTPAPQGRTAPQGRGRGNAPQVHPTPPRPPSPPSPEPRDLFLAKPWTYAPRYDRPVRPRYFGAGGYPYWPWPAEEYGGGTEVVSSGYLAFQVQPTSAQVYVDGLYVGTVDDVRGAPRGIPLEPGAHHLELRAAGYQPAVLDVRIDPGETRVFRGDLMPERAAPPAAAPAPAAAAAPAKTFYVIPGCYAGDKRPDPALLPRRCDASKLRAVPPVVGPAR